MGDKQIVAAITSKLQHGNISAAVRLLCSEDNPAEFTTANLRKLQNKHPQEHTGARIPPTSDNMPALQVSEDTVLKAIRSFPAGSAPGPTVLDPIISSNLCSHRKLVLVSSQQ